MKRLRGKWGLTLVILLCLAPAALAAKPKNDKKCDDRRERCHQAPEGGSAVVYLLAAGVTCAGAMVIRSRETKLKQTS
jgi:hypothetical protein